ncbi:hypothetical protein C1N83_25930 [Priestia aryabhattai]
MAVKKFTKEDVNKRITAEMKDVSDYVKEQYSIPSFQDEYRWEEEETETLIEDVYELTKQKDDIHILAEISIHEIEGSKDKAIVNGFQRTATILILFSAIRDFLILHLGADGKKLAEIIHYKFVIVQETKDDFRYRLELPEMNKSFVEEYIFKRVDDPKRKTIQDFKTKEKKLLKTNKNLYNNYQYIMTWLKERYRDIPPHLLLEQINHLWSTLLYRVFINVRIAKIGSNIRAENSFNENAKNKDLKAISLIKGLIFELNTKESDPIHVDWNEMLKQGSLIQGSIEVDDDWLKHAIWSLGIKGRKEDTFRNFKTLLKDPRFATKETLVEHLLKLAILYKELFNPTLDYWEEREIVEMLEAIRFLDKNRFKGVWSVLMAAKFNMSMEGFKKVLYLIESIYLLNKTFKQLKLSSQYLEGMFAPIPKFINEEMVGNKDEEVILSEIRSKIREKLKGITKEDYIKQFKDYSEKTNHVAIYMQLKYFYLTRGKVDTEEVKLTDIVSREHMFPQSYKKFKELHMPHLKELGYLKDENCLYWKDIKSSDAYDQFKNLIANSLILTKQKNAREQAGLYLHKRDTYLSSNFPGTSKFARKHTDLTFDVLVQVQNEIGEKFACYLNEFFDNSNVIPLRKAK